MQADVVQLEKPATRPRGSRIHPQTQSWFAYEPPDAAAAPLTLQRDIRHLQLERDLLKKANEIVKKGLGVDLQLLTNREKTLLVDALKELYTLPELLAQLDLARSSYFYH
jgi:hypothetical protein